MGVRILRKLIGPNLPMARGERKREISGGSR